MANATRNAILRALIEGIIVDLMVKTSVTNVYIDDNTTLAAKLAEIITSLNKKATTDEVNTALAGKAEAVHSHSQDQVNGLTENLSSRPTTVEMNAAISNAITELINGAPGTYDTLKEISDYISSNEDVVEALNQAIGNKADASVVASIQQTISSLGALATKSVVAESDLDSSVREKLNSASQGNHSHDNKALLDTYTQTNANLADAVSKKHSHDNKAALDSITSEEIAAWNGKGKFYATASQPVSLKENDLWAQLI